MAQAGGECLHVEVGEVITQPVAQADADGVAQLSGIAVQIGPLAAVGAASAAVVRAEPQYSDPAADVPWPSSP